MDRHNGGDEERGHAQAGFDQGGGYGYEGFGGSGNYAGNRGLTQGNVGPGHGGEGYGGRHSEAQGYEQRSGRGRGFSGRGPKGYQRSDERIKEQISDRLMDDDDIDASEITVEVANGEVTLNGTVNSRQEKRAAEDAVEQMPGVREVQNRLRIKVSGDSSRSKPHDGSSQAAMSKSADRE